MSEKLSADEKPSTLSDEDHARIDAILAFWFREAELSAPQVDRRMDTWFGEDAVLDHEIADRFTKDIEAASAGQLEHWADEPRGRLALILLLDQFRRNIYRGTADAYALDRKALKLCVEGAMARKDDGLSPIEKVFFFMPLQHSESPKVQAKSVELFSRLAQAVTPTYRETFQTIAHFAELHADIIDAFGRFPHRNAVLGRENTEEEAEYLAGEAPDFGQEPRESVS